MGRQRNRSHMKEQEESPEKKLNEMETSNLSRYRIPNYGHMDAQGT